MKLEKQCCTVEQAHRLKDLGIKQDSKFSHIFNHGEYIRTTSKWFFVFHKWTQLSAFTVAEMLLMMDAHYFSTRDEAGLAVYNKNNPYGQHLLAWNDGKDIGECIGGLLIERIESGDITIEQINKTIEQW